MINAIKQASKGKTRRHDVRKIIENIDFYANQLRYILVNEIYKPSLYDVVTIIDDSRKKERIIYKPKL